MNKTEKQTQVTLIFANLAVLFLVLCTLSACENFQLPLQYDRGPCSDTTDTSSTFANVFTTPHEVEVLTASSQQFWPIVSELSCSAVSYRLSKNVGSVDANGLYSAPATLSVASDTLYLYVQSLAKRSLVDTVQIVLSKPVATACDLSAVSYTNDIQPLLDNQCMGCHNAQRFLVSGGGVNLDSIVNLRPYALNGRLLASIDYTGSFKMPRQASRMDSCSVRKIKAWIDKGAPND